MDACIRPFYPPLTPRWRANRVLQLIDCGQRPRRWDDTHVRVYYRFLRDSMMASFDQEPIRRPDINWIDVQTAHQLQYQLDAEPRHILQARILSRESLEAIAARLSVSTGAVALYELLFFNVLDRLECKDWIFRVIKGAPENCRCDRQGNLNEGQLGYIYRWIGYFGGPLVLDNFTLAVAADEVSDSVGAHAAWIDNNVKHAILRYCLVALLTFEFKHDKAIYLIKRWRKEMNVGDRSLKRRNTPPVDLSKNIEAFLNQLASVLEKCDFRT